LLRWASVQRRGTYLTPERKAKLDQLGFVWSRTESRWDELFAQLIDYKEKHGEVNILHSAEIGLRRWVANQRRKKRQGLLSAEGIEKLEQIGLIWKTKELLRKGRTRGRTQETFEHLVLRVLRDVGRPMRSDEVIREFRKRGHPIPGNEVRAAYNRLWTARTKGILTNETKLGYWIAGEPLSEEAKQKAAQVARLRPRGQGPSLRVLSRGKKKGPPPALSADDVERAEEMLLSGKSLLEVGSIFKISLATLRKYIPGGIGGLKAKYPNVVVPRRPYVRRTRGPGLKRVGRPAKLTPNQALQIADMRAAGTTINEIAAAMGVKRGTIYSYLKKAKPAACKVPEPIGEDAPRQPE
jgi:DNA-binding CsgD family transcriptional regulator